MTVTSDRKQRPMMWQNLENLSKNRNGYVRQLLTFFHTQYFWVISMCILCMGRYHTVSCLVLFWCPDVNDCCMNWNKLPRDTLESPSLEILKPHGPELCWSCPCLGNLQRSLLNLKTVILWSILCCKVDVPPSSSWFLFWFLCCPP